MKTRLAVVGDIKRSGSAVLAATPLLRKEGIYRKQRFYSVTISTFYLKHTQYKKPLVSYKWLFATLNTLNHSHHY
ncbi:hypothetical protein ACFVT3_27320 [Priestia megaterium]|uniref:hypothetical protein n=1 Tax=Priestia megaterium TaxID=1404 RepID=UPI0036D7B3C7